MTPRHAAGVANFRLVHAKMAGVNHEVPLPGLPTVAIRAKAGGVGGGLICLDHYDIVWMIAGVLLRAGAEK